MMNVQNMRSILVSFLLAFVLAFGVSMPAFAYEEGAASASGEDGSISVAAEGAMVILDANGNSITTSNIMYDVDDGQFNVSVQGAPSNDVVWRSANEMVAQVKYGAAGGFDSNTKATIVITGQGSTPITVSYGSDTAQFRVIVQPIDIDSSAYTWGAPADCVYTGNFLEPPVTITGKSLTYVNGTLQQSYGQLKEGTDYMIEYYNNRDIGTATAVVTGVGNYKGTRTFTFQITQAPASGSTGGSSNSSGSGDVDQSGIASDAGATTVVPQEKPSAPEVTGTWKKSKGKWWFSYDGASAGAQNKPWPADEWVTIKGKQYHFKADGYMNSGWFQNGSTWYYLGSDGAMKTGWQKVKGKWYYLASDGIMQTGKKLIDNKIYFLTRSGAMKTGWNQESAGWYYYTSSGAMKTGWQKVKGKWYYLEPSNGLMKTGFYDVAGARYYSDTESGAMETGWVKTGDKWYHFKSSGAMNMNWAKVKGKWYYLDPVDGSMWTGFCDIGGDRYYLDSSSGAMKTGWLPTADGKWYHFKSSGVMETNAWISGKYWVGEDGVMATNAWVDDNRYYVDANGKWVKGKTQSSNLAAVSSVYWVPDSDKYHVSRSCSTLNNSKNVNTGSLSEAMSSGHNSLCKVCG